MGDPTEPIERVLAELDRCGHNRAWLARKLNVSQQSIYNWTRRGIPADMFAAVAKALDRSVDWVAGVAPFDERSVPVLSPMARKLAEEFDAIDGDHAQLVAFVRCLAIVHDARRGEPLGEPMTAPER